MGRKKNNCRSIHAVTERMAAPGCGSGRARRRGTVVHSHSYVKEIDATQAAFGLFYPRGLWRKYIWMNKSWIQIHIQG